MRELIQESEPPRFEPSELVSPVLLNQFNLIVRWQSLEDHSPGFEQSEDHQRFMLGLEDYFSAEPMVYHIEGGAFPGGDFGVSDSGASVGL